MDVGMGWTPIIALAINQQWTIPTFYAFIPLTTSLTIGPTILTLLSGCVGVCAIGTSQIAYSLPIVITLFTPITVQLNTYRTWVQAPLTCSIDTNAIGAGCDTFSILQWCAIITKHTLLSTLQTMHLTLSACVVGELMIIAVGTGVHTCFTIQDPICTSTTVIQPNTLRTWIQTLQTFIVVLVVGWWALPYALSLMQCHIGVAFGTHGWVYLTL